MILSHPHRDHVELLPDLFDEYEVRHVWDSGRVNDICGYRAFLTAVRDEAGVEYHNALQDFGSRGYKFAPKKCYGASLPEETLQLEHGSRISAGIPVVLGQGASMTILHADGANHSSPNENSIVVRLDLGATRVLLMGDAEAGGRKLPSEAPTTSSIEGNLLTCCASELSAHVLVVGHHGSMTSSRRTFLDAVGASMFLVSAGPTAYGSGKVVLPDDVIITELEPRGQVLRTDVDDAACRTSQTKIGPIADGAPGGCTNIRISIGASGPVVDSESPPVSPWNDTAWPFAEIPILPDRQSRWMN
jgi:competence protein ComEC